MIIPFITELTIDAPETVKESITSEAAFKTNDVFTGEKNLNVNFQSMVNNMEETSARSYNNTESENKPETEMSFSKKYELILKRIEKERFERELLAGSR